MTISDINLLTVYYILKIIRLNTFTPPFGSFKVANQMLTKNEIEKNNSVFLLGLLFCLRFQNELFFHSERPLENDVESQLTSGGGRYLLKS